MKWETPAMVSPDKGKPPCIPWLPQDPGCGPLPL